MACVPYRWSRHAIAPAVTVLPKRRAHPARYRAWPRWRARRGAGSTKSATRGLIKLVEDEARGILVGSTSVGPRGGEVLGLLTLAVHAAVPTDQLRRMIYAYPTFHRAVEDALRDLKNV